MKFTQAVCLLSDFIVEKARQTEKEVGFGWVSAPDAPASYEELQEAFARSTRYGSALPVSSENSEQVVYSSKHVNLAMRFWHDVSHVRRGLSFSLVDELALGLWHLEELAKSGYPRGTLVSRIFEVDLLGQNYLLGIARRFPRDQRQFVSYCLELGLHEGVLYEALAI